MSLVTRLVLSAMLLPVPGAAAAIQEHEIDRSTPQAMLEGFLQASRRGDYRRAATCLELPPAEPGATPHEPAALARQLKVVLDRTLRIDLAAVSARPGGVLEDGLAANVERVGAVPYGDGAVPVYLTAQEDENGRSLWSFEAQFVGRIPLLYDEHGYGRLGELLPEAFFQVRILELELWQWLGVLFLIVFASAAGYLGTSLVIRFLRAVLPIEEESWDRFVGKLLGGPLRLMLSVGGFYFGSLALSLSISARSSVAVLCQVLSVLAATWLFLRIVDVLGAVAYGRLREKDTTAADTLVPMGRRITKIFVIGLGVLSLVHNLGFNVAGVIAGLGVGGLAVALAAQKTIENLFGGISVIADGPVEVGQFCRVGDHVGTVEDIGMRSTRIRTLDRTLVTIPNAEFSTVRIENYGSRDKMRLYTLIQVTYDTSPEQMRFLLVRLREVLYAHPKTLPDPCRVRFTAFNAYSLDLEVFVFVDTRDWSEFLGVREDIYLRIMDVVKEAGTSFAYPSQTLYLGRDAPRDAERVTAAEAAVSGWRADTSLPLPEFPPERVQQLADTLDFPPRGSSTPPSPAPPR